MFGKIGFIGSGNIGSAMIGSIIKCKFIPSSSIYVYDINEEKLDQLNKDFGINLCKSNVDLVNETDVIVIAVKPQIVVSVIEEIKKHFSDKMLITIAAGIPISVFENIIGNSRRIFRALPNLPLVIGEGISLITYKGEVASKDIEFCKAFFENFGMVQEMDESLLDSVISLTSSSPAYVFLMIESIIASAVSVGVPVNIATRIVAQTILGSAKMFLNVEENQALRSNEFIQENACSEFNSELFNESKIRQAILEAMVACNRKAMEFKEL